MTNKLIRRGGLAALALSVVFLAGCKPDSDSNADSASDQQVSTPIEAAEVGDDVSIEVLGRCDLFNRHVAENGIAVPALEEFEVLERRENGGALVVAFTHEPYEDEHGHFEGGYDISELNLEHKKAHRRIDGQKYPYGYASESALTSEERYAAVQADCLFNEDSPLLPAGFHLR